MSEEIQGDDFPVVVPRTYPYRFVLVDNSDGNGFCNLEAEFVPDEIGVDSDSPDVWSSDAAAHEALAILGYSVKVVKK